MTTEEAIKQLYKIRKEHLEQVPNAWGTRNYYETKSPQIEALDMATESLKQPQIIRCKDCKHLIDHRCYHWRSLPNWRNDNDYCSRAERREEE